VGVLRLYAELVERLIVDGYNIIFAWPELSAVKDVKLEDARDRLVSILADYAAMTRQKVTVVFDSHRRPDAEASEQMVSGVQVLYSGRKTSADHVIEKLLFEAKPGDELTVATSDALQRDLALGRQIKTVSALTLKGQVDAVLARRNQQIGDTRARSDIARRLEDRIDPTTRQRLDRMRHGDPPQK
jgi:predicted RNA-binding protein with PIN domain